MTDQDPCTDQLVLDALTHLHDMECHLDGMEKETEPHQLSWLEDVRYLQSEVEAVRGTLKRIQRRIRNKQSLFSARW